MNENEIIKALECCSSNEWNCDENCPFFSFSFCSKYRMSSESLNIINRQKAEIDTLKAERDNYKEWYLSLANEVNKYPCKTVVGNNSEIHSKSAKDYDNLIANVKSEAMQDFAERLKATIIINNTSDGYLDYAIDYNCLIEDIDDLVKEMTEEKE